MSNAINTSVPCVVCGEAATLQLVWRARYDVTGLGSVHFFVKSILPAKPTPYVAVTNFVNGNVSLKTATYSCRCDLPLCAVCHAVVTRMGDDQRNPDGTLKVYVAAPKGTVSIQFRRILARWLWLWPVVVGLATWATCGNFPQTALDILIGPIASTAAYFGLTALAALMVAENAARKEEARTWLASMGDQATRATSALELQPRFIRLSTPKVENWAHQRFRELILDRLEGKKIDWVPIIRFRGFAPAVRSETVGTDWEIDVTFVFDNAKTGAIGASEQRRTEDSLAKEIEYDRTTIGEVNRHRGDSLVKQGEYDRAIAEYNEAIRLDPREVLAIINRGFCFYRKALFPQAISDYSTAIAKEPTNAEAYNNRGAVWKDMGQFEKAIADFEEALRCDPAHPIAQNNLRDALAKMTPTDLLGK